MSSSTTTPPVRRSVILLGLVLVAAQSYQIVVFPTFLSSLLAEPGWRLSAGAAGLTGSAVFVAMPAGAVRATPWALRFGRRRTMLAAVLWTGLWSAACAVAAAPWQLGVFRLLAGLGMGVTIPLVLSFARDAAPTRPGTALGIPLAGIPIAGIITQPIVSSLPVEGGWRVITALGLIPCALSAALSLRLLPRDDDMSALASAAAGRPASARRVSIWFGAGMAGLALLAAYGLSGRMSKDLRFHLTLNACVVVAMFVLTAMAIRRTGNPPSRLRTLWATTAFVVVNPGTVAVGLVMVLLAVSTGTGAALALFGVWVADGYNRSLSLWAAPHLFPDTDLPPPLPRQHADRIAPEPVQQPVRPAFDA